MACFSLGVVNQQSEDSRVGLEERTLCLEACEQTPEQLVTFPAGPLA